MRPSMVIVAPPRGAQHVGFAEVGDVFGVEKLDAPPQSKRLLNDSGLRTSNACFDRSSDNSSAIRRASGSAPSGLSCVTS